MSPPNLSLTGQPTSTRQLGLGYAETNGHTVHEQSTHAQFAPTIPVEAKTHVDALLKYPVGWVFRWLESAYSSQYSTSRHHHTRLSVTHSEAGQPLTIDDKPEPSYGRPSRSTTYWCIYCDKSFSRKGDWKRHEENFHEPQRQWNCPSGCKRTFSEQSKLISHHKKDHGCHNCMCGDIAKVEVLPRKIAWGCGFCGRLLLTWNARCDHIASHFEGSPEYPKMTKRDWDHTKFIQGLLSQPHVQEEWRSFLRKMEGASADTRREFSWDPKSTSELIQHLEYRENLHDLSNTVQLAYALGSANQGYSLDPSSMLPPGNSSRFITPASRSTVNESALDSSHCHSTMPSSSATYFDVFEQESIGGNSTRLPELRSEESPANVSSQAVGETQAIQNFLQQLPDSQDDPEQYQGYGQYGPWASSDDHDLYAYWDTAEGVSMFPSGSS